MGRPIHIIVLAGASKLVSDQLASKLDSPGREVVSPAAKNSQAEFGKNYSNQLLTNVFHRVKGHVTAGTQLTLSLWHYELGSREMPKPFYLTDFFPFAFPVTIPDRFRGNREGTVNFVTSTIADVSQVIAQVGYEISSNRNSSPVVLPLRNFESIHLSPLIESLGGIAVPTEFSGKLRMARGYFRRHHSWRRFGTDQKSSYHDNRDYAFRPSAQEAAHGHSWPTTSLRCYLNGHLRLGASLVPGWHYDVASPRGKIEGGFSDCEGSRTDISARNFTYINVFPNDHYIGKNR